MPADRFGQSKVDKNNMVQRIVFFLPRTPIQEVLFGSGPMSDATVLI